MSICPQLEQPFYNFKKQISSMNEGWNTQLDPDRVFTSPLKEWPLQVLVGINDNFINNFSLLKCFVVKTSGQGGPSSPLKVHHHK